MQRSLKIKPYRGAEVSSGRILIGNDVWIGAGVQILSGVKIGNGAIVGAGSVVTRNVPPYAVVAGNPARVIRYRFSDETIERIQASKWWMWTEEQLRNNVDFLIELHDSPIK